MDNIAANMRAAELTRRSQRRQILLKQLANEAALLNEDMSPADREAHAQAIQNLQRQQAEFAYMLRRNYWTRLWAAIWNKP